MTETVLRVRGITKSFGARAVLRGIDLDAHRGDVIAILGGSGSGKSTFLRCLNLLELPDAGTIEIAGAAAPLVHDTQGRDSEDRHRDGAVLFVPDLCHADLLADNRLRCHDATFLDWVSADSAGTQTLRPGNPERSARLVRLGVPASGRLPSTSAVDLPVSRLVGSHPEGQGLPL